MILTYTCPSLMPCCNIASMFANLGYSTRFCIRIQVTHMNSINTCIDLWEEHLSFIVLHFTSLLLFVGSGLKLDTIRNVLSYSLFMMISMGFAIFLH